MAHVPLDSVAQALEAPVTTTGPFDSRLFQHLLIFSPFRSFPPDGQITFSRVLKIALASCQYDPASHLLPMGTHGTHMATD